MQIKYIELNIRTFVVVAGRRIKCLCAVEWVYARQNWINYIMFCVRDVFCVLFHELFPNHSIDNSLLHCLLWFHSLLFWRRFPHSNEFKRKSIMANNNNLIILCAIEYDNLHFGIDNSNVCATASGREGEYAELILAALAGEHLRKTNKECGHYHSAITSIKVVCWPVGMFIPRVLFASIFSNHFTKMQMVCEWKLLMNFLKLKAIIQLAHGLYHVIRLQSQTGQTATSLCWNFQVFWAKLCLHLIFAFC